MQREDSPQGMKRLIRALTSDRAAIPWVIVLLFTFGIVSSAAVGHEGGVGVFILGLPLALFVATLGTYIEYQEQEGQDHA